MSIPSKPLSILQIAQVSVPVHDMEKASAFYKEIYFKVDDIQSSYQSLVDQKVSTLGSPHVIGTMENTEFWMAFFRDPDDNVLAVTSEITMNKDDK